LISSSALAEISEIMPKILSGLLKVGAGLLEGGVVRLELLRSEILLFLAKCVAVVLHLLVILGTEGRHATGELVGQRGDAGVERCEGADRGWRCRCEICVGSGSGILLCGHVGLSPCGWVG
jgi:hypothetical protein